MSLNKQCQLLHVSKSSLYCNPIKPFYPKPEIFNIDQDSEYMSIF